MIIASLVVSILSDDESVPDIDVVVEVGVTLLTTAVVATPVVVVIVVAVVVVVGMTTGPVARPILGSSLWITPM